MRSFDRDQLNTALIGAKSMRSHRISFLSEKFFWMYRLRKSNLELKKKKEK